MERHTPEKTFAVVLAAGEGSRMAPLTRALYGYEVPKQFAALDGDKTLLQRTMDRIAALTPPERTVVVVSESYQTLARAQLRGYPGVEVVSQPLNLKTGPGILLPLAHVKARNPGAQVAIFPSDHHVRRPVPFIEAARAALTAAAKAPSGVALLGAAAERPAVDLGWIVRGERIDGEASHAFDVHRFVEKPPEPLAMLLLSAGSLWNTMVIAGSVDALWRLSREHMPTQTAAFDRYLPAVGQAGVGEARAQLYSELLPADFSREVLAVAHGLAVVPVIDSGWFDCGTPERLLEYLRNTPELSPLHDRMQRAISRVAARKSARPAAHAVA